MKRSCMTLRSPHQYKFGMVMRQAHRTFQRRKKSSVRNVNQPIKPLLQIKGETCMVLTFGIGDVIPAMVLHKGQQVQVTWTKDVPVGVHATATSKGCIIKQKFHEYSIQFVCWLKTHRLLDRPHLLIIDSHKSHIYNVAFFDCMKANNIYVMAIPPHTSHIVQALDST